MNFIFRISVFPDLPANVKADNWLVIGPHFLWCADKEPSLFTAKNSISICLDNIATKFSLDTGKPRHLLL